MTHINSTRERVKAFCQKHNGKALILLEHEGQVADYSKWSEELGGQAKVVALSPFAMYQLDKMGIPYSIPEDYCDPRELYRLGVDNFQTVESFADIIDRRVQQACPGLQAQGIKPAFFCFLNLKRLYDVVAFRLFQLRKIIDAEKPACIFIYDSGKYPFGTARNAPIIAFDDRESIFRHLLDLDGWQMPVMSLPQVSLHEDASDRERPQGLLKRVVIGLFAWMQSHPMLFEAVNTVRRGGIHGISHTLRSYWPTKGNRPVLLFGGAYNWGDCSEELVAAKIKPIYRMNDDLEQWLHMPGSDQADADALAAAWVALAVDTEFRRFFRRDNVDFFPVVAERLKYVVEKLTPVCARGYEAATAIIAKKRIGAVLFFTIFSATGNSVAQAAHNAGVPVITWQHGAYGTTRHPLVSYGDLTNSNVHFTFGEGVAEMLAEPSKRFGSNVIPVGSSSLDRLSQGQHLNRGRNCVRLVPGKKVVLYAIDICNHNNFYVSTWPPTSDNRYWSSMRATLDVLASHHDWTVVVKMHPNSIFRQFPGEAYASDRGFKDCQFIKNECSFADLLPIADAVVIGYPTTTLLQALTTSKPIFVYLGHLDMERPAQELLMRRASCHRELKDFLDALDKFLSGQGANVDLEDKVFLRRYGTHQGASGQKVASILRRMIESRKP